MRNESRGRNEFLKRAGAIAFGLSLGLGAVGCGDDGATNPGGQNQNPGGNQNQNPGGNNNNNNNNQTPKPNDAVVQPIVLSQGGHDRLFGAVYDGQGNLYTAGVVANGTTANDDFSSVVVKFLPDGSRDPNFGANGVATKNIVAAKNAELARGIVVQSTGKIVISAIVEQAGSAEARERDVAFVRFNTNGTVDTTFGEGGVRVLNLNAGVEIPATTPTGTPSFNTDSVWGLTLAGDDKLVFVGAAKAATRTDTDWVVGRLTADGNLDTTFDTDGLVQVDVDNNSASPRIALLGENGSLVVSGYMRNKDSVVVPVLFKLTSAGAIDETFGVKGVFTQAVLGNTAEVYGVLHQGDKFVTTGYGRDKAEDSLDWVSLRVNANGTLDNTYGENGVAKVDLAGFNDNSRNLAALPDGRILLIGGARPTEMNVDAMIAVLTADGQPDDTFFGSSGKKAYDLGGAADFFWGIAVSPDKKKVAIVGLKGVGNMPAAGANDDGALLVLPL